MRTSRLLLAIATATAVAVVAAITWFDSTHLSMGECVDLEAKEYAPLDRVAQEVTGAVGDRTRRGSLCEEAGEPGAEVHVSVYDWATRRDARTYLHEAGVVGGSELTFEAVNVSYATSTTQENDGRRYVTVSFSAPR